MKNDMNQSRSIHLRLNLDLLKKIDDFTEEYYFRNRTDAMRFLIATGLKYYRLSDDVLQKQINEKQKNYFDGND